MLVVVVMMMEIEEFFEYSKCVSFIFKAIITLLSQFLSKRNFKKTTIKTLTKLFCSSVCQKIPYAKL